MAMQKERQTSEHLPLAHVLLAGELLTYTVRHVGVVGHQS
jgi:hypothetical protein